MDVGLEELDYRDGDLGVWEITIGFRRVWKGPDLLGNYERLAAIASRAPGVLVTPNTLTEASNLLASAINWWHVHNV